MDFFRTKDQTRIAYEDRGEGTPVLLIHGWPLSSAMWEYQTLDLLRRGYRVITYDRRGFGASGQPASGYDYNTFADDLNSLIVHLGLSKVSLVGFSMGGGEIAHYLARYGSSQVASVALVSAVTPYMLKTNSNPHGVDDSVFIEMITKLDEDRPAFLTSFTKQFFGINLVHHPVSQETQNWCFNLAMQASLNATIACVKAFGHTDFRADMTSFDIPTLIIHGSGDKTVPIATTGEQAAQLIPSATYKVYDGAPHGLFITHRKQLSDDLITFFEANRFAFDSMPASRARIDAVVSEDQITQ